MSFLSPTLINRERAAGVNRSYLYRDRDLLGLLHQAQTTAPATSTRAPVSNSSLVTDLANANARNKRLTERNRLLENKLSGALGQELWRDSALGAPVDVETLQEAVRHRDQQLIELRRQLDERDQELAAARAANRELISALNAPTRSR